MHNEDGKPVQISRVSGTMWTFDEDGEIAEGLSEEVAEVQNSMGGTFAASSKVVSLKPQLSKRRIAEKYRWEPSSADINRIIQDIWPKTKVDRLIEAKGVSRRRPPLTYDAKHAIEKVGSHFWEIVNEIGDLKDPGLKGFVFEARKRSKEELEYRHLYEALANMGQDQLELSARRRSGKGIWYAVVEVLQQGERFTETVRVIQERCAGRSAAVAAARRLLSENAHLFDEHTTLEVSIMTDLEWETRAFPDNDGR
ncbi:hypothetical protein OCK02_02080 [Rhizobium sp. TRM96647]|uniref:hypothetical protein n=1 Tax=unclassified Rhizobium TaxID=2613769 RepID=UPI0021E7A035|nr:MULTISPECIES: hypothetical protein [unclassified Rhizobium]MCV3734977.1 hypothetical protein [Rhizobium sp. TRM96647]MCV3757347.1 hypothetical protein [Rhizobium sp. TRM96650]